MIIVVELVTLLCLLALISRGGIKPRVHSVVFLVVGFYLLWSLGGFGFYQYAEIPKGMYPHITPRIIDLLPKVQEYLLYLLIAFCMGVIFYLYFARFVVVGVKQRDNNSELRYYPASRELRTNKRRKMSKSLRWPILVLIVLALVVLVMGVGLGNLLDRDVYLISDYHQLKVIGMLLGPLGVLGAGYLFGVNKRWFIFVVLAVAIEVVFFSIGTRRMALMPMLFFIGMIVGGQSQSRLIKLLLIASIVAIPFLLALSLGLRSLPEQGLIPYISFLTTTGFNIDVPYGETIFLYVFQNVLTGVPLTGYVMSASPIDINNFLISINPLPGFIVGWPDIALNMRVSIYIPYNALGELLNYGVGFGCIYFFLIGVFIAHFDMRVMAELQHGRKFIAITLVLLVALFLIFSTQYHLRSATRFIYYAWFLLVAAYIWKMICRFIKDHRLLRG